MENKKLNNEGFSLIELIVVIAIMAILAGVLALNLPKFAGSAKTSVDTQLADSIKSAVEIALVDPNVNDAPNGSAAVTLDFGDATTFSSYPNFGKAVAATLGYASLADMTAATGIETEVQSTTDHSISVSIAKDTLKVSVTIGTGSDKVEVK